jgi:hypothetical protein
MKQFVQAELNLGAHIIGKSYTMRFMHQQERLIKQTSRIQSSCFCMMKSNGASNSCLK